MAINVRFLYGEAQHEGKLLAHEEKIAKEVFKELVDEEKIAKHIEDLIHTAQILHGYMYKAMSDAGHESDPRAKRLHYEKAATYVIRIGAVLAPLRNLLANIEEEVTKVPKFTHVLKEVLNSVLKDRKEVHAILKANHIEGIQGHSVT